MYCRIRSSGLQSYLPKIALHKKCKGIIVVVLICLSTFLNTLIKLAYCGLKSALASEITYQYEAQTKTDLRSFFKKLLIIQY